MDILTWLSVGLIAGVLASLVMGGTGLGIIGDIVIGIVGAFVGGYGSACELPDFLDHSVSGARVV